MPFIGNKPSAVPLTSADIADGIITSAKIVDGTIVNGDINASAAIDSTKLSGVQGKFESQLLHVRDEKSSNTSGGTLATGSFVTRTLNTSLTNEISGASLASNQITLPSGTYFIFGTIPAYQVNRHKTILRNTTDSTNTLIGNNSHPATTNMGISILTGRFTIASQKTFEIQNRIQTSNGTQDGGVEANYGTEVYTDVQIWKVA